MAHELNAEENRQFFSAWFEGFAICWTFRKGVNSLWRKIMILMCSGDRASVRACARVWNVVFCLYFLIVFIIYAKKKRKNLMVKSMQNFQQDLIWFAHRKGESPVSFSGTEYREREKTHIYFCYFVCVWDECLSRGRSTREVRYSPSVEWTNLSVSEQWIFRFFV